MRPISWETYYSRFYDWAESTQAMNVSCLTSLGPADEVAEIITELQNTDIKASDRLLKKAVEAKLVFSSEALSDFLYSNDKTAAKAALANSAEKLTEEDMEELYSWADDDELIISLCRRHQIPLPEALRDEVEPEPAAAEARGNEPDRKETFLSSADIAEREEVVYHVNEAPEERPAHRGFLGFLTDLFAADGTAKPAEEKTVFNWFGGSRRHNGKCNGDCAHCPPHYGYRYGRWYYGHDHIEGCEFGGNKGGGGL